MIRGVDVSDWQSGIDWGAVAAAGYSFALIKATEGTGNTQATFAPYRRAIPAAGLGPVLLYHFARPENGNPEGQADHYCDVVGTLGPDEAVVLDIETGDQSTWPDFALRWFARVDARLGPLDPKRCCIYMSDDPTTRMPASLAHLTLWDAAYGPNDGNPPPWGTGHEAKYNGPFEHSWNTGPWPTWTIWQYSSKGSVPGIGGQVDVNIAPDDLRARLGLGTIPDPKPIPIPTPTKETRKMYTLFNYGGGVWAWIGGDPLPLLTQEQVQKYLDEGAVTIGDVEAGQFSAIAPTWTGQHPAPGVTSLVGAK